MNWFNKLHLYITFFMLRRYFSTITIWSPHDDDDSDLVRVIIIYADDFWYEQYKDFIRHENTDSDASGSGSDDPNTGNSQPL